MYAEVKAEREAKMAELELVGVTDVARIFNVTPRCVQQWDATGNFVPRVNLGGVGRTVRFRLSDVEAWIAERTGASVSDREG